LGLPVGLGWGFTLMAGALLLALLPAFRLRRDPAGDPEEEPHLLPGKLLAGSRVE
jgi:hypothetical protein